MRLNFAVLSLLAAAVISSARADDLTFDAQSSATIISPSVDMDESVAIGSSSSLNTLSDTSQTQNLESVVPEIHDELALTEAAPPPRTLTDVETADITLSSVDSDLRLESDAADGVIPSPEVISASVDDEGTTSTDIFLSAPGGYTKDVCQAKTMSLSEFLIEMGEEDLAFDISGEMVESTDVVLSSEDYEEEEVFDEGSDSISSSELTDEASIGQSNPLFPKNQFVPKLPPINIHPPSCLACIWDNERCHLAPSKGRCNDKKSTAYEYPIDPKNPKAPVEYGYGTFCYWSDATVPGQCVSTMGDACTKDPGGSFDGDHTFIFEVRGDTKKERLEALKKAREKAATWLSQKIGDPPKPRCPGAYRYIESRHGLNDRRLALQAATVVVDCDGKVTIDLDSCSDSRLAADVLGYIAQIMKELKQKNPKIKAFTLNACQGITTGLQSFNAGGGRKVSIKFDPNGDPCVELPTCKKNEACYAGAGMHEQSLAWCRREDTAPAGSPENIKGTALIMCSSCEPNSDAANETKGTWRHHYWAAPREVVDGKVTCEKEDASIDPAKEPQKASRQCSICEETLGSTIISKAIVNGAVSKCIPLKYFFVGNGKPNSDGVFSFAAIPGMTP